MNNRRECGNDDSGAGGDQERGYLNDLGRLSVFTRTINHTQSRGNIRRSQCTRQVSLSSVESWQLVGKEASTGSGQKTGAKAFVCGSPAHRPPPCCANVHQRDVRQPPWLCIRRPDARPNEIDADRQWIPTCHRSTLVCGTAPAQNAPSFTQSTEV